MSKKKAQAAEKLRGAEGFDTYYSRLYGARWQPLKAALLQEACAAAWRTDDAYPAYFLDRGSIKAALSLPLGGAERILDMCAAPGGKTLVVSSLMDGTAELVSNERSHERMMRLSRVADEHLPPSVRARVRVTCGDGARLCLSRTECYDRILLDAPCSSERHVLSSPQYLCEWSPARVKTLSVTQWALLSSAFRLLRPGGYLLYATCALSPAENDEVVARLEKKFSGVQFVRNLPPVPEAAFSFFDGALPDGEPTAFGVHVLPDSCGGAGPLYFSLIRKGTPAAAGA